MYLPIFPVSLWTVLVLSLFALLDNPRNTLFFIYFKEALANDIEFLTEEKLNIQISSMLLK